MIRLKKRKFIWHPTLLGWLDTAQDSERSGRMRIRLDRAIVLGMTRPRYAKGEEVEFRPDGWERFREAVHAAAKSGPIHRAKAAPKRRRAKSRGIGGAKKQA